MAESVVLFLAGPTASGKTAVGVEVAERLGAEVISLDSMAVYRGMDIATAKATAAERSRVRHHLMDIREPHEHFSAGEYAAEARQALGEIQARGKTALFVGGTPLYLKAMTEGLFEGPSADWELREELGGIAQREGTGKLHEMLRERDAAAAARIHANDLRRLVRALEVYEKAGSAISSLQTQFGREHGRFRSAIVGLRRTREDLYARIEARVERMFEEGLVEETRALAGSDPPIGRAARQAVGYAETLRHLAGELTLEEAKEEIKRRTRRFARKQLNWFRHFPSLRWVDVGKDEALARVADRVEEAFREEMGKT
ncbi:MAG: tRNA (adenosine(37)-N6)-dimethylallyltransferase MiaA [Planctomycetota bacterium]